MRKPSHSLPKWLRWPVRRSNQVLFAEALSQLLSAGVELTRALQAAGEANPSSRFRAALLRMNYLCQTGKSLADSLSQTNVRVAGGLLTALEVGEERGCLAEQLAAFARWHDPQAGARLAAEVGRSPGAARFAAALATLLSDRRLTVSLVEDAGRLAGGGNRFNQTIGRLATSVRNGVTFTDALAREKATFDPLFCLMVKTPEHRSELRAVLARLGEDVPLPAPRWVRKAVLLFLWVYVVCIITLLIYGCLKELEWVD
ncbi:type II secretion system F family protein [Fimbriiglobus ruber]|uniref:Type II secretion system protein GspF domain-containing protein n=1 Tax=Fimbriiglobus ruber TaxID=1908690 RepID=A0A225E688_9BACT|nr:type II secretion system F family protein [Fimbriiglobus ruber]OWK45009.1 hypothetical protein FRUB_01340 [Fimbriiglobus ruber]